MQPARRSGAPVHTIAGLEVCASLDLPVFSEGCVTRAYTMAVALGMMHLEANTNSDKVRRAVVPEGITPTNMSGTR